MFFRVKQAGGFSRALTSIMPQTDSSDIRQTGLDPQSRHPGLEPESRWYAARIVGSPALFTRRLAHDGIHSYRTRFAPGIVFMRCTAGYASVLISDFWGKLYFYLNPERKFPAPIPEKDMNNFILVTSASDELIPLGEVTPELLKGDRVRVTSGVFRGAEGVVKRIKGDHRLIVSIDCLTAVATCFIRADFLEKI